MRSYYTSSRQPVGRQTGFPAGAVVLFIHWRVAAERHGGAGDLFLMDRGRRWPRRLSSGVSFAATGLQRPGDGGAPPTASISPIVPQHYRVQV